MRLTLVRSALLLLGAAVGCQHTPPQPTIPAAADVASIHLKSVGSSLKHAYDITLTKDPDIVALVDWLKQIDWSPPKAKDLSNVKLAEVGQITVTMKDGTTRSYGLSGGSIIVNRWEWRANTDRLTDIAKQAGANIP